MLNFLQKSQSRPSDTPLGGRYQVIQQLGEGGFGKTFLARDKHLPGHPVCVIKQLNPQVTDAASLQTASRLFDTEAQVLYQLGDHNQIPRLMAHFEDGQEFYLAQEFVDSEPLGRVLVQGEPWPQGRALALLQDLLQVLSFVHEQNVIHRDIKPANLLCRRQDGRIVLIDFGAVKQVNTQFFNPQTGRTNLTISIGTQGYMPNEQLGGTPHFSSDVYAVGVIGIQALTGIQPKHFGQDPRTGELEWRQSAPDLAPEFADVLDRMVRYDFRARYPTAAEALKALQQLPAELQEMMPEHWYTPQPGQSYVPGLDTSVSEANITTEPWSLGAQVASQAEQSRGTLPAMGRRSTNQFDSSQKPRGSTLVVSVLQALPQQRWWLLGAVGLGALLLALRVGPLSSLGNSVADTPPAVEETPTNTSADAEPDGTPAAAEDTTADQAGDEDTTAAGDASGEAQPVSQVTSATPVAVDALLSEANSLREGKQFPQALAKYDEAIAAQPESVTAHWGRCFSLNRMQQLEQAIASCDQAIALDSSDPRPISSKGFAFQQQERHGEALALFDQAIALQPDYVEALNNRGVSLLRLKRFDEALAAFDKAVNLQPDLAEAWNNRGATLWSLRRFDDAVASIDQAITLDPNYTDALSLRQQMRDKLGR